MTTYKLSYFDFDGGRGEPIRIAFHAAGIAFEDDRWTFQQFGERRSGVRFTCLPVLGIDDVTVTQSNSMCRYVGKLAGLYPEDALQALYCDEVMDAVEDLIHYIVPTMRLEGEAQKKAREELQSGWMTTYLRGLEECLERGGGKYFADNRCTVADLKVYVQVRSLIGGRLDHIDTGIVKKVAPLLADHCDRIAGEPVVKAYYASRKAA